MTDIPQDVMESTMGKLTHEQIGELRKAAEVARAYREEFAPWSEVQSHSSVTLEPETLLALIDMIPVLRPIEEAPDEMKDGRDVMLRCGGSFFLATFGYTDDDGRDEWQDDMGYFTPTHYIANLDLSALPTPEGE